VTEINNAVIFKVLLSLHTFNKILNMITSHNKSLKTFNTFGIDVTANTVIHLETEDEAERIFRNKGIPNYPVLILGGGSNILFLDNFNGTVVRPEMKDIRTEHTWNNEVIISAGAGVTWDDLVSETVELGLSGLENLSLIPGTVGATPVQNIGAYGVEVSELITKVDAISTSDGSRHVFNNKDCGFGYRTSIFKKEARGEFLITRVHYSLSGHFSFRLGYGSVKEETERLGGASLKNIREAVINLRKRKLPDPGIIGNAGSFFKNPVVSTPFAAELSMQYPEMPVFDDIPGYKKIAAGWLIEQCGWKGKRVGEAGVHDRQALVLVNYGSATGYSIYNLSEAIKQSVKDKFNINLEREVELAGII